MIVGPDGSLYGTTMLGGLYGGGTAFRVTRGGTVTILHGFRDAAVPHDAWEPNGLVLGYDGNFYGSSWFGGVYSKSYPDGYGTVFRMTPKGEVTVLHSFFDGSVSGDGENAHGGLVEGADGNLYGTT